ncbi:uncharacterized protein FFMR_06429 [Fusarium fujikuroi]|nr:uncharacterized protein FFMR_06429 [Fusarium fujikuroi]
MVDRTT